MEQDPIFPFEIRVEIAKSLPLIPALQSITLGQWDTCEPRKRRAVVFLCDYIIERDFMGVHREQPQTIQVLDKTIQLVMESLRGKLPDMDEQHWTKLAENTQFLHWYLESYTMFNNVYTTGALQTESVNLADRVAFARTALDLYYVRPLANSLHLDQPVVTWYYHVIAELMATAVIQCCKYVATHPTRERWITIRGRDGLHVTLTTNGTRPLHVGVQLLPDTERTKWQELFASLNGLTLDNLHEVVHLLFQTIFFHLDPEMTLRVPLGIDIPQKIRVSPLYTAYPNIGIMGLAYGMRMKLWYDAHLPGSKLAEPKSRTDRFFRYPYLPATGPWWNG